MPDPEFFIGDEDRYSRLKLIQWWDQAKLGRSRVLVVGAGALGNEVLKNLALVGIGAIDIVDFDCVERSNLSRAVLFRESDRGRPKAEVAAASLRGLNPEVVVRAVVGDVMQAVGLGRFRQADVVIGCLDNREARLWVNRCCWRVERPWIDGGIQEIDGVVKAFIPPDGPCYECGMTDNDYRLINLRYSCPQLSLADRQMGRVPTAPTIASIIGGLQVQEALKLLHGLRRTDATALVFNGTSNQLYQTRFPIREDCLSHETYEAIVPLGLTTDDPLEAVWAAARRRGWEGELLLDRDWVRDLTCDHCHRVVAVERPRQAIAAEQAVCAGCGQPMRPSIVHRLARGGPDDGRPLRELGVPDWDILRLECSDRTIGLALRPIDPAAVGAEAAADRGESF